jgi:hypothetical protein
MSGDRIEHPESQGPSSDAWWRVDSGVLRHGIDREGRGAPANFVASSNRAIDVADQSPDHPGFSPLPWGYAEVGYVTHRVAKERSGRHILRSSLVGKYSMASAGPGEV